MATEHVHDQRFDGDDPYLVCKCGQRWNALTGEPLNWPQYVPDPVGPLDVERLARAIGFIEWPEPDTPFGYSAPSWVREFAVRIAAAYSVGQS